MSPQLALPPISPKGHFCDNCGSSFGDRGTSKGTKGEIETKPCYSVHFSVAPTFLKFNEFITGGYRKDVRLLQDCIKSAFAWTNETINIWTHFMGWLVFFSLSGAEAFNCWLNEWSWEETVVKFGVLLGFQCCMLLSSCYHTFCCCSDASYRRWLTADLVGVASALLGIYLSGIYFAYKCDDFWLNFYLLTVFAIFLMAMSQQFYSCGDHSAEEGFHWRLILFGFWAAYGIVPTIHWAIMKGLDDPAVQHLLPRIVKMYILSTMAFFFYVSRFPERLYPGRFNYVGSSHQIWHVFIFIALFYWYTVTCDQFDFTSRYDPCVSLS